MGFFGALGESINQVAYSLSKNGFGKSMAYNAGEVAQSAAYNKVAAAARSVIGNMDDDAAKAVRSSIKSGTFDFGGEHIEGAITKMMDGDDASKKAAQEFTDLRKKYYEAQKLAKENSSQALGAYANVLGREDGTLNLLQAGSGYFLDKQHGGTRIGTTLATGAGVGVATRFLSGGSLTRTASGESDIAGIPFF